MPESVKYRSIHPFPARMAPSIALSQLAKAGKRPLRVLDPMVGSGTTLVVARSRGHQAFGFDTDPLALLISKVWSTDLNAKRVMTVGERVMVTAQKRWKEIRQSSAYPIGADENTKEFIRYWFDVTNRRQLRALAESIFQERDASLRSVLWCAFSRLIIAKSNGASWAMDLAHSRPHKVVSKNPYRPIPNFMNAISWILNNSSFVGKQDLPKAIVRSGDARAISLPDESMDIVLTSPPYLNAIDYIRCNKFSLVWMGHATSELRSIRSSNIGAESASKSGNDVSSIEEVVAAMGDAQELSDKNRKVISRYVFDMSRVVSEVARVLSSTGRAIFVVGDSMLKGVYMRNSRAIIDLAKSHHLQLVSKTTRKLPSNRRYLPPPSSSRSGKEFQTRMGQELVLSFVKRD